jgi:hypothetical protein
MAIRTRSAQSGRAISGGDRLAKRARNCAFRNSAMRIGEHRCLHSTADGKLMLAHADPQLLDGIVGSLRISGRRSRLRPSRRGATSIGTRDSSPQRYCLEPKGRRRRGCCAAPIFDSTRPAHWGNFRRLSAEAVSKTELNPIAGRIVSVDSLFPKGRGRPGQGVEECRSI